MNRRRNTVFLLLAGLAALPCAAQTPPTQQLTLQQAEQIALQNHPQVQAAMSVATAPKRK